MSKYRSKKCTYDDIEFDSQLERDCYLILDNHRQKGLIAEMNLQHKFPLLSSSGKKVGDYIADFLVSSKNGKQIVVEAKGIETDIWKWKRKHYEHDYNIPLLLIKRADINELLFLKDKFFS